MNYARLVAYATANGSGPHTLSPDYGAIQQGDIIFVQIATRNGVPSTTIAGFTQQYRVDTSSNEYVGLWWRIATGSEADHATLSLGSSTAVTMMTAWRPRLPVLTRPIVTSGLVLGSTGTESVYVPRNGIVFRLHHCCYQSTSAYTFTYQPQKVIGRNQASDQQVTIGTQPTTGGETVDAVNWQVVGNAAYDYYSTFIFPPAPRGTDTKSR